MSNNTYQPHEAVYNGFAYESVTVANTAQLLTLATYRPNRDDSAAKRAVITCETAQIRYRYDGTDPTSSEGHILNSNDVLTLVGAGNIEKFRAIRTGATSGVLKVTYER